MPEIVTKIDNGVTSIRFSGDLDIRNSDDIRKQLLALSPDTAQVKLILENTDNIDLSFLQLLYALILRLKKEKKIVVFSQELNDEYERIVRESGFFTAYDQLIKQ